MLWFSNITLITTLITTINAVYLGTRQEGFTKISSDIDEEFNYWNKSESDPGSYPPPVPDNDRQNWSVEVSCFVSGLLEMHRFPAPLLQGLIL